MTLVGALVQLRQHGGLGRLQHAIEPAEHGERQDHFAVVGLLVVPPEQIGDGPYERGQVGIGHKFSDLLGNEVRLGTSRQCLSAKKSPDTSVE